MRLEQLTSRIFYYPHQPETDRPMLAYINGSRISLAIDAGNSAAHVDEFYGALAEADLKKPDITVITHWHWDHTFGMHHIHGLSAAHMKTNEMLEQGLCGCTQGRGPVPGTGIRRRQGDCGSPLGYWLY